MIETILVPVDFKIESEELLSCVGELTTAGLKKVILLHVVDIYQAQGLAPMFEENARNRIVEYSQLLEGTGIDVTTLVVQGDVSKTIVRVAEKENVDCIVMGATTSGALKGRLMGRTTEYISRMSGKAVLIEKYDALRGTGTYIKACSAKFSKVMLPIDFSENSRKILAEIQCLRDIIDELIFVHILEEAKNGEDPTDRREQAIDRLCALGSGFESELRVSCYVSEGKPAEEIDRLAEEMGVTLIAITNRGLGSVKDILLGSTAQSLLRGTRKPVLLIPAAKR